MNKKIINYIVAFSIIFGGISSKAHAGFITIKKAQDIAKETLSGQFLAETLSVITELANTYGYVDESLVRDIIAQEEASRKFIQNLQQEEPNTQEKEKEDDLARSLALALKLQEDELKNKNNNNTHDIDPQTQELIEKLQQEDLLQQQNEDDQELAEQLQQQPDNETTLQNRPTISPTVNNAYVTNHPVHQPINPIQVPPRRPALCHPALAQGLLTLQYITEHNDIKKLKGGIYHIRSNGNGAQNWSVPRDWSCGYSRLADACRLEKVYGISNISFQKYCDTCQSVSHNQFQTRSNDPTQASSNTQEETIAQLLGLQPLRFLHINNGNVQPALAQISIETFQERTLQGNQCIKWEITKRLTGHFAPVEKTKEFTHQPTQQEKDALEAEALKQLEITFWNRLKIELYASNKRCIHFACFVTSGSEPHCIGISLVKTDDGSTAMYISDNMNEHEPRETQDAIRQYVLFLYNTFFNYS